jgi:hypothetical protein
MSCSFNYDDALTKTDFGQLKIYDNYFNPTTNLAETNKHSPSECLTLRLT